MIRYSHSKSLSKEAFQENEMGEGTFHWEWKYYTRETKIQGVQDKKCQKEMAISLEGSTFHTTMVKPKCVRKLCISYAKS